MPAILAISRDMDTENRMIETSVRFISSGSSNPLPMVVAVCFPAINAPRNTIIPYKPGIALFLITLAPYAAENDGPVPLPPIVIARNNPIMSGIMKYPISEAGIID
jgi:hypothetical protein